MNLCGRSAQPERAFFPPEVDAIVRRLTPSTRFTAEDVHIIYGKFLEITEGQNTVNFAQFTQVLNSLNLYPNSEIARRIFNVVKSPTRELISFGEFFSYICLLLEGAKSQKTAFLFQLISPHSPSFGFAELAGYFADVLATPERRERRGDFPGTPTNEEMAYIVFDLMKRPYSAQVSLDDFFNFLEADTAFVELFDFLKTDYLSLSSYKMRKNLFDIQERVLYVGYKLEGLKQLLTPVREEIVGMVGMPPRFQELIFNKKLHQPEFAQLLESRKRRSRLEDEHSLMSPSPSAPPKLLDSIRLAGLSHLDRAARQPKPAFFQSAPPVAPQALEPSNPLSYNFAAQSSPEELRLPSPGFFGRSNSAPNASAVVDHLQSLVAEVSHIIAKEVSAVQRDNRINENVSRTLRSPAETQRLVYFQDKNWNLVTTMVSGIQKSLNIVAGDRFHVLTKADFKMHNKIELESLYAASFTRCKFKDYAPYVFQSVRRLQGISQESYVESLGINTFKSTFYDRLFLMLSEASEGKSGSFFFHTSDSRYMIKTVHRAEFLLFKDILRDYYRHLTDNPRTLLNKFFGLHQMKCYGKQGQLVFDIFVVVLNNVFEGAEPEQLRTRFDLKGSTYGRRADPTAKRAVLKDLDALEQGFSLELAPALAEALTAQVVRDATFLSEHGIIDYSLLVGVAEPGTQGRAGWPSLSGQAVYFIGIIDCLTEFSARKKGEFLLKRVVEGAEISCVPPDRYCARFVQMVGHYLPPLQPLTLNVPLE